MNVLLLDRRHLPSGEYRLPSSVLYDRRTHEQIFLSGYTGWKTWQRLWPSLWLLALGLVIGALVIQRTNNTPVSTTASPDRAVYEWLGFHRVSPEKVEVENHVKSEAHLGSH